MDALFPVCACTLESGEGLRVTEEEQALEKKNINLEAQVKGGNPIGIEVQPVISLNI